MGGFWPIPHKKGADLGFSCHREHDGPKKPEVRLWYRPGTRRSVAMTPTFLAAAGSACRSFSSGSAYISLRWRVPVLLDNHPPVPLRSLRFARFLSTGGVKKTRDKDEDEDRRPDNKRRTKEGGEEHHSTRRPSSAAAARTTHAGEQ